MKDTAWPYSDADRLVLAAQEAAGVRPVEDQFLYIRGDRANRGDRIPRGFIQVAAHGRPSVVENKAQSGRLELADWIASRDNPLTARAIVNRVWHHLFGVGIVSTVDNFGTMGEMPSNQQLLDHLAVQFMDDGWSVKKLIRRLVLSHVYQLSTVEDAENAKKDGDNRLFWRMNRRRLEAESIRDAILVVSGRLETEPPAVGQFIEPAYQRVEFDVPYRSVYCR